MIFTKELKDFVTTLEQSKDLFELGIDYKTKFVWYVQLNCNDVSIRLREKADKFFDTEIYPAFLTDELINICFEIEPWMQVHGVVIKNKTDLVNTIKDIKTTESGTNNKNKTWRMYYGTANIL